MANTNLDVVVELVDKISKPLEETSKKFKDVNTEFLDASKKVGAAMTAMGIAGVAAIGKSVSVFMDFEKEMSNVKAITNIAGKEMEDMTKLAMELGATTKFTAKEAAEGMTFLGMAGFNAKEIMQAMPATMNLAAASNTDLASAADIASNVLTGFRLTADETIRVVDVLAATVTSSNVNMSQLSESMKYFAPTAAAFGVSLEEASAAVGLLGNAGIQGSIATRALGTALTRLTKPTDGMIAVMDLLNLSFFNAKGEFIGLAEMIRRLETSFQGLTQEQKMSYTATLFGMEAIQEINVLLAAGSNELSNYTKELQGAGGTADRMAKTQMDNLAGSIELLSGAFDGLMLSIGMQFEPLIRRTADILTWLVDKFNNLSEGQKTVITVIFSLVTAFTLLGGGIILIIGFIQSLTAAFITAKIYAGLMWASITGPVLLVVAAIGAVIAAGYLIVKNWDWIKAKAIEVWTAISTWVSEKVSEIVAWVTASWESIKAAVSGRMEEISNAISEKWQSIKEVFELVGNFIWNFIVGIFGLMGIDILANMEIIKTILSEGWNAIKTAIVEAWTATVNWVMEKLNTLSSWMKKVWSDMKVAASIAWNATKDAIFNALEALGQKIRNWVEPIREIFASLWEGVKNVALSVFDSVKAVIADTLNWIIAKINKVLGFVNMVVQAGSKITGISTPEIPQIPMLADGGIVNKPTLAMIGEAGPEAVVPLSRGRNYGVGGQNLTIIVNGDVTGEDLIERIGRELTRTVKMSTATV